MKPPGASRETLVDQVDETLADSVGPAPSATKTHANAEELPGYRLGEQIGLGGMGEILVAFDETIEREVAVKRMRASARSPALTQRFLREAKVQGRLDHPAIIPVYELGTDSTDSPYFTMKRLVGTTLAAQIAKHDSALQPLLRAFVDVCFAIELAHERGVIHRDLKPSNVMLGNYGDVYVIDWGIARLVVADPSAARSDVRIPVAPASDSTDTATGDLLGTPGYMSPEQVRGEDITPKADVYSLGAILFEILTGQALHPSGTAGLAATLSEPTDSPARRRPDRAIAPELDALCLTALAARPEHRPSARALAESVQRYLDGDRDLEQRRTLAAQQLAAAREALGDPDRRAEAGQAASRALALDPQSAEAAGLVTRMILEPPVEPPPDLIEALDEAERGINRTRARSSMWAFASMYVVLPAFMLVSTVKSPLQLGLLFAVVTFNVALSWRNTITGRVPLWLVALSNVAFALMMSRLAGSFMLTGALVCGQAIALAGRDWFTRRSWFLNGFIVFALASPTVLEALGVIEPTWHITSQGLVVTSTIFEAETTGGFVLLTIGQILLVIVACMFSVASTRAAQEARRKAHTQAWHFERLIPRGSTGTSRSTRRRDG
jgi:serine/threonine-protein kinase